MKFRQFIEGFDRVSDFLLNPEHRNKTWEELMKEFEASGGKWIGSGRFGQVYEHPNWPYVLKTFKDDYYLRFVRFAYNHPHSAFPRFYGPAKRIVPFYRRNAMNAIMYIIRMEKLEPVVDKVMLKDIFDNLDLALHYFAALDRGEDGQAEHEYPEMPSRAEMRASGQKWKLVNRRRKIHYRVLDVLDKYPQAKSFYEGLYLVSKNIKTGALDMHGGNVMQRANGELVIIDPLWEGSNPYQDAQRLMDMETDRFAYERPPEADVLGGKLPKRERRKKVGQALSIGSEEIPF